MIYLVSASVFLSILYEQSYMLGLSCKRKRIEAIITYSVFNLIVLIYSQLHPLKSDTILHTLVLACLTISSYVDMKTKEIPVHYGFTLLPILCWRWILTRGAGVTYIDMILIVMICFAGKYFKKIIGLGDIYLFSLLALIYGIKISLSICCMGLIFIGVYALFLQSIKGILLQKKLRIALSPCISAGFIVFMFLGDH